MILLIWDQCGQEELTAYEFEEGSYEAELARFCDGKMVNASNDDETDEKLGKLSEVLVTTPNRLKTPGPFGPYSAIYISGYRPLDPRITYG